MSENNNYFILSIVRHDVERRYASVYTEHFIHKERKNIINFFIDYCNSFDDEVLIEYYDIDINSDESITNFFENNDTLELYHACKKYIIDINEINIDLKYGIHIDEEGYSYE